MPESLEKFEQTDGERWAEDMLADEIQAEAEAEEWWLAQQVPGPSDRDPSVAVDGGQEDAAEAAWELVESSPSERLLAPMPQPRTVLATEPVSKRVVAFPVAGMVAPAAAPRAGAASPPDSRDWDAKAARERARGRFLKAKAERADKRAQKSRTAR